jgi:hypothetical protein
VTVAELISRLQGMPPAAAVCIEVEREVWLALDLAQETWLDGSKRVLIQNHTGGSD